MDTLSLTKEARIYNGLKTISCLLYFGSGHLNISAQDKVEEMEIIIEIRIVLITFNTQFWFSFFKTCSCQI